MRIPLYLKKHILEDEYPNRFYRPLHFLIVVFGSVHTQGPRLRMWVEQSYKHVKRELGWSQYQVRSDKAMRRHWQLVCCAFSFCWYHASHPAASGVPEPKQETQVSSVEVSEVPVSKEDTGKKAARHTMCDPRCPGQEHCEQFEDGWSPGSCCADIGVGGPSSPHLRHCNSCLAGLNRARPSHSTALLDPLSTNYR